MGTVAQADVELRDAIVSPAKLAHVVLRTAQYERLLDWYMLVLHATPAYRNDSLAFISYDDEHHRIAILAIPDLAPQPEGVVGVHHFAFTYDSLRTLLENYERLAALGIEPVYPINHGPTTSLYYADPDGNQIELQVDNFDTAEESTDFFFSEAFAKNPIGVEFDPADLLRRLRAGEDERLLKARPDVGQVGLADVTKIR